MKMKCFGEGHASFSFLCLILVICFISDVYSCSCYDKCSVDLSEEECGCHTTKDCVANWDRWKSSSTDIDRSSMDIAFHPVIKTFVAYGERSAVNITFKLNTAQIRGFAFRFEGTCFDKNDQDKPRCRYYDFRNATSLLYNAVFYTDEFWFESDRIGIDCAVDVIALNAHSVSLYFGQYIMRIPDYDVLKNSATLSKWQSLVVLDITDMHQVVGVYFTTAPQHLNITTYKIRLLENGVSQPWEIIESSGDPVVYRKLEYLDHDVIYIVQVSVNNGSIAESASFRLVGYDFSWLTIICGILIAILVVAVIAAVWIKRRNEKLIYPSGDAIKVFMVYSHDIKEHVDVVQHLAEYLNTYCHCTVLFDIWHVKTKDPHRWVSECISAADFILIIWSRGAQLKMKRDNTKVLKNEPGYLGENLFSNAMAKISAKIARQLNMPHHRRSLHRFINISLPYVPKDCVPSELDYLPHYRVPSQFNTLLCFLHRVGPPQVSFASLPSSSCYTCAPCTRCYPSLPFSKLEDFPGGEALLSAIDKMQAVERKGNWLEPLLVEVEPPHIYAIHFDGILSASDDDRDSESQSPTSTLCVDDDSSDDEKSAKDNLSTVPIFPPNVQEMPIFGPNDSQVTHPCWPPVRQLSTNSLVSIQSEHYADAQNGYGINYGTEDSNLNVGNIHIELPSDIFGPSTSS